MHGHEVMLEMARMLEADPAEDQATLETSIQQQNQVMQPSAVAAGDAKSLGSHLQGVKFSVFYRTNQAVKNVSLEVPTGG